VECGSWGFWVLTVLVLPWVLVFSVCIRRYLLREHARKARCRYVYVDGDIEWGPRNTIVYPALCSIAGLCAGMFGIGGGIIKAPLMIELGVRPEVASATSAFMICFTSATASICFYAFGLVQADYGTAFFLVGLVSSTVGQLLVSRLIRRTGRSSIIVIIIGAVVLASAALMVAEGVHSMHSSTQGMGGPSGSEAPHHAMQVCDQ